MLKNTRFCQGASNESKACSHLQITKFPNLQIPGGTLPTVALLLCSFFLRAQSNLYLSDLQALRDVIQKTHSYKSQIRGENLDQYNALFKRLAADSVGSVNSYKYFFNLAQLFLPLRDNHLAFYQTVNYQNFRDRQSIERFVATKEFAQYPTYAVNLDSLKTELAKKPVESIEGIYHYGKYYSVGLFRTGEKEYTGIVIQSTINLWLPGQVAMHLYEYQPNLYKAIYGHPQTKAFIYQGIEKYRNQSLVNSSFYLSFYDGVYSKKSNQTDYINLPKNSPQFELKNINSNVQYLLVKTFQANNITAPKSKAFADSIKDHLTAPNLILDLRNNDGGAKSQAKVYLGLLKKYTKKGKLYVLINNGTLSQAEMLLLELRKLDNVTVVGQTTKGMLTYGSNYGKTQILPSQKFQVYPTDMKGKAAHLKYEDIGIEPDVHLSDDSEWMGKVLVIITKNGLKP
jgi:hypothetical protein